MIVDLFCQAYQDCREHGDGVIKSMSIAYTTAIALGLLSFLNQVVEELNGHND